MHMIKSKRVTFMMTSWTIDVALILRCRNRTVDYYSLNFQVIFFYFSQVLFTQLRWKIKFQPWSTTSMYIKYVENYKLNYLEKLPLSNNLESYSYTGCFISLFHKNIHNFSIDKFFTSENCLYCYNNYITFMTIFHDYCSLVITQSLIV